MTSTPLPEQGGGKMSAYKDQDGKQHPDTIAMSIVYNLGDALYEQLRGKVEPRDFVKARQATNDDYLDYATELIAAYVNEKVEESVTKFGIKKGVRYDIYYSDAVIVLTPKEDTNGTK